MALVIILYRLILVIAGLAIIRDLVALSFMIMYYYHRIVWFFFRG